jgi:hypothetical protein
MLFFGVVTLCGPVRIYVSTRRHNPEDRHQCDGWFMYLNVKVFAE